ncbi:hypothetical protein V1358_15545 [Pseudoalteromonas sp. YIC-656]|uniref:hypothetical protein n=1 Tax=Pseudoalteromonas pernae TaxID=3118054 RepID=UPI003242B509
MNEQTFLGSEQYPLRLTPHGGSSSSGKLLRTAGDFSTQRKNLDEQFVDLPHEKGRLLNFYKVNHLLPYAFTKNVISNPYLTALETKLALYLNDFFLENPEGGFFILETKYTTENIGSYVGQDNLFYYGTPNDSQPFYDLHFAVELQSVAEELNIEYRADEIRNALICLHNFSYITVTEVCWANAQVRGARSVEVSQKNAEKYGLVIQMYPKMDEVDISQYWKTKPFKT